MTIKQFLQNDIFRNTLVAKPRFEFCISNGKIVKINNSNDSSIGASLTINDAQVIDFGIFHFNNEWQSFMIAFL